MCFEKMLWGISEMVNARAFKYCAIVFSTPENLLVKISGALGTTESHFPKLEIMFSRKCSRVSQKQWMLELWNLCHCVQHPWKLTNKDFWSSRNDRKSLSQQKCVLRKCCGVSQKWWMLQLLNICHCVQHPWKLTSKDFWNSMNNRKPLSQQKCVLRKCWRMLYEQQKATF